MVPHVLGNEHVRYWCTVARGQEPELKKPRANSLARTWWGHLEAGSVHRTIDLLVVVSITSPKDALLSLQAQLIVAFVPHTEACVVMFSRQATPRKEALRAIAKNMLDLFDDRDALKYQFLKYVLSDTEAFARVVMVFYSSATGKVSLNGLPVTNTFSALRNNTGNVVPPRVGRWLESVTMNVGMVRGSTFMSERSLCGIYCPVSVQRRCCCSANHHVRCYGPRTMARNIMCSTLVHKYSCSFAVAWALLSWAIREATRRERNPTICDYEATTQHHTLVHNYHHHHSHRHLP